MSQVVTYLALSKREKLEEKTVVQDTKTLVPNFQLVFSVMRQIPATSSTFANEFLLGLGAYNRCYLRLLLEITSQRESFRYNAVKSTETY